MRHGKKYNHLGRKSAHRKSLLNNLAVSLIEHKRLVTTLAKAKELRKFIEPLITRAKSDSTHNRRTVFAYLQDKEAIKELFGTIASRVGERPGGYTRILKLGTRVGDGAEQAYIELVDFNEYIKPDSRRRRRTRRGAAKPKAETTPAVAEETAAPVVEDATIVEVETETPAVEGTEEETQA
ncbi:MAG: 50S ribosomal protein L17 [Bacteroidia bacterium]|nr:50S ribosomal protein L17 [Bacteroidia bacterium]